MFLLSCGSTHSCKNVGCAFWRVFLHISVIGLFVGLSVHRPQGQGTSDGDLERTGNILKNTIIEHISALHFERLQHCRLTKIIALLTKLELP